MKLETVKLNQTKPGIYRLLRPLQASVPCNSEVGGQRMRHDRICFPHLLLHKASSKPTYWHELLMFLRPRPKAQHVRVHVRKLGWPELHGTELKQKLSLIISMIFSPV